MSTNMPTEKIYNLGIVLPVYSDWDSLRQLLLDIKKEISSLDYAAEKGGK